jgi:hypothetical protein
MLINIPYNNELIIENMKENILTEKERPTDS